MVVSRGQEMLASKVTCNHGDRGARARGQRSDRQFINQILYRVGPKNGEDVRRKEEEEGERCHYSGQCGNLSARWNSRRRGARKGRFPALRTTCMDRAGMGWQTNDFISYQD